MESPFQNFEWTAPSSVQTPRDRIQWWVTQRFKLPGRGRKPMAEQEALSAAEKVLNGEGPVDMLRIYYSPSDSQRGLGEITVLAGMIIPGDLDQLRRKNPGGMLTTDNVIHALSENGVNVSDVTQRGKAFFAITPPR